MVKVTANARARSRRLIRRLKRVRPIIEDFGQFGLRYAIVKRVAWKSIQALILGELAKLIESPADIVTKAGSRESPNLDSANDL